MATRFSAPPQSARRAPRQQRSRATVDAIVEAAAHVLAARGWTKFTTNEVARVAGASIGSLYQYFPDKLALAEAIRERHLDAVLAVLPDPDERGDAIRLETRVAQVIDGIIAIHSTNQRLHRVLLDEVPLAARASLDAFEVEYLRRYEALILQGTERPGAPHDAIAAQVLASAVEGVVHAAALRGELGAPEVRRELNGFVCAYLRERRVLFSDNI
ncbi:TetR family transcriptional regulator [Paraburkholderia sp. 1N]|uniref:TetR family transcriptional regulator n=1 Tax=Paraburkholderia solitsugae TaxID=2675748 RepID=A0ABX2C6E9_9BURK|nr:TetR/AcrR family transcriptional regulator [Paraburkholderia solitsugae]NPT47798.1 TetR family transcriptional regulator [Paraburkholderia solitsugae]